jgi:CheY-like chemotaxis protein
MNDETQLRWETVKEALKTTELNGSGVWWDHEDIRDAIHWAALAGIDANLVLACREACESHTDFVKRVRSIENGKRRILAVDDEQSFLNILAMNLEDHQFEVRTESNSERMIDAAREFKPDLILLDVVMPGIDGLQLLSEIRLDEELKHTSVIMLTALAEGVHAGGVTENGTLYLSKPLSISRLVHCINEHLRIA